MLSYVVHQGLCFGGADSQPDDRGAWDSECSAEPLRARCREADEAYGLLAGGAPRCHSDHLGEMAVESCWLPRASNKNHRIRGNIVLPPDRIAFLRIVGLQPCR